MSKFPLIDRNGKFAEGDVPDDILEAARRVRHWMSSNNVTLLCGLSVDAPLSVPHSRAETSRSET